jgi:aspartate aminotransferase
MAMPTTITISPRASQIEPSATIAAAARAKQLKSEGIHVYDFTLGEPDFPTPAHICEAARAAIAKGQTHYTPSSGIPELRKAIATRYSKQLGTEFQPAQVIVSNGAKHSLHNVLTVLCSPGDEVIIPAPYWVSYSELVKLTGAEARIVETSSESGFKLSPAQLRRAITPKSRMLMLNSPCNPTGSVYSPDELRALADVVLDSNLLVLSDEIYEHLVYGSAKTVVFASLHPKLLERTVTVSGVSKSYAMTGWRIGWSVSPLEVARAMDSLQSQETSNPCSVSQFAAVAALEGDQGCVREMLAEFSRRRDFVLKRLRAMPRISVVDPQGAFYAFIRVADHFGRTLGGKPVRDSSTFCSVALEVAHVALVPGSAFGAEGYVRMSFASEMGQLEKGLDSLARLVAD